MKKPTSRQQKAARDAKHFACTVTPRQEARMKTGRVESTPDDYAQTITDDGARLRDARHAAEERRWMREAGI